MEVMTKGDVCFDWSCADSPCSPGEVV